MRRRAVVAVLVSCSLFGWWACDNPDEPLTPSLASGTGTCSVKWTYIGTKTLTVAPNSTNNYGEWFFSNIGTATITITGDTPTKSGTGVAAVRRLSWATFPSPLPPGQRVDAGVLFDAAASGSGSVGLKISTSCGVYTAPAHLVTVSAPSGFRFPVGMSKGQQTELLGIPPTPDGQMGAQSASTVTSILNAARSAHARITIRVTPNNQDLTVSSTDSRLSNAKWKTGFDKMANVNGNSYLSDGTLIGLFAIDEPFTDFSGVTGAQLDSLCQYAKSKQGTDGTAKWSQVPCFVRDINTRLADNAPSGGYRSVDAGWAQIADHHYVSSQTYGGDMGAYFRTNLSRGAGVGLGLMYGFNLINGGREVTGCTHLSGNHNCAMSPSEIEELADTLADIGNDKGCGVNGWQIDPDSTSAERSYYSSAAIQSALQYLNTKVGGLRPGPCG